jgi:hypothetical protein
MDCQIEKLEEVGTEIIAEAEATVNGMIKSAGLEHLRGIKNKAKLKIGRKKGSIKVN